MLRSDETKEFTEHCAECSAPLSPLEQELYGSRCAIHARAKKVGLIYMIIRCLLEYTCHNVKVSTNKIFKDPIDRMAVYQAALGEVGCSSITSVRTNARKLQFIWAYIVQIYHYRKTVRTQDV